MREVDRLHAGLAAGLARGARRGEGAGPQLFVRGAQGLEHRLGRLPAVRRLEGERAVDRGDERRAGAGDHVGQRRGAGLGRRHRHVDGLLVLVDASPGHGAEDDGAHREEDPSARR